MPAYLPALIAPLLLTDHLVGENPEIASLRQLPANGLERPLHDRHVCLGGVGQHRDGKRHPAAAPQ
jgi:hypothetical protein